MDERLCIHSLGGLSIQLEDQPVEDLGTRKAEALLVYLAGTGRSQAREVLAELLWDDRAQSQAQANLRVALSGLRKPLEEYLEVTRESVGLNSERAVWYDAGELEAGLQAARENGGIHTQAGAEQAAEALALYQGEFLEGFYLKDARGFNEWQLRERERLHRLVVGGLQELVGYELQCGAYAEGLAHAERLLGLDPLNEAGQREMMQLLAYSGRRAEALAQYEAFRGLLWDELAVEPSAATQALYEKLRGGGLARRETGERQIRGYELLEQIGSGGYGAVYRAYQPAVEREVAVKVILPQYANDPEFIRRFEAEAQLVARLEHPHIVPLYDYWREPDGAYLVMRLYRGGSLAEVLAGGEGVGAERAAELVEEIASGLAAAHQQGVVHRDLKPANILLDEAGQAYLTDFGIAKVLDRVSEQTQPGALLGSPEYSSPEQLRNEPVTPRSDIYSLGMLAYQLLSGEPPFAAKSLAELVERQLQTPVPRLAESHPELPAGVDGVIQKATAKDPCERYPDALAFAEALRAALGGQAAVVVTPQVAELSNPYKGLQAFSEADAADFFGREALTARLVQRLGETSEYSRFLAVVGPSGSGKSSVVRAGLIPALRSGALPGSQDWYVVEMLPGRHPFEEVELGLLKVAARADLNLQEQLHRDERGLLRAARLALPEGGELLLVIDQFEELYTLAAEADETRRFLDSLAAAVTAERSPVRVVITLRADFYDRPLMHPELAQLVQARTEVVLPLSVEELEAAIRKPAERAGAQYEDGLVASIVGEVVAQPGALPLLQYALTELFARCDGRCLTYAGYEAIGGVAGALGKRAEALYLALDETQQAAAKQVFLRLVTLGEGVEDTRRRVLRSELETLTLNGAPAAGQVEAVLDAFGKARLLSFDRDPLTRGPTVEVAHEALLREWARLREWLDESRADLRMQRVLSNAAGDWEANQQDPSFLLRGARLEQYAGWAESTSLALTASEQAYLTASRADEAARQAQREQLERRSRNFLRALVAVFAVAALVAGVLSVFAIVQRQTARMQAGIGLAGMALNELHGQQPERAVPLALEAVENYPPTWQTRRALGMAVLYHKLEMLLPHGGVVWNIDLSEDEKRLLTNSSDGVIRIWDTTTGTELVAIPDLIDASAYWSPGESQLLVLGGNDDSGWWFQLRDGSTGELIKSQQLDAGYWYWQDLITPWAPDGTRFAIGLSDGTVRIWDANSGAELQRLPVNPEDGATWSPAGDMLLTLGHYTNEITAWDTTRWEPIDTLTEEYMSVFGDWSPTGDRFAIRGDGEAQIYETASGKLLQELLVPGVWIQRVRFSPDGTQIITSGYQDGMARVWEAQTGEIQGLIGGLTQAGAIVWAPDGGNVAVCGVDGVHIWDKIIGFEVDYFPFSAACDSLAWSLDGERLFVASPYSSDAGIYRLSPALAHFPAVVGWVAGIGWSPDGQQIGVSIQGGTANIYRVENQELVFTLDGGASAFSPSGAWSPSGDRILFVSMDGPTSIWDASTGELLVESPNPEDHVFMAAWSPDGSQIAGSINEDDQFVIWDAATLEAKQAFSVRGNASNVSWSPDGSRLAVTSFNGEASIRDAATGEVLLQLFPEDYNEQTMGITWLKNGQQVIVFALGTGYRFDAQTGQELMLYSGHSDVVSQISLSPDEKLMYTLGADGTSRVFDVESGVDLLEYEIGGWLAGGLSPDGSQLLIQSSTNGTADIYPVWQTLDELAAYAKDCCMQHTLTPEEREQFGLPPR